MNAVTERLITRTARSNDKRLMYCPRQMGKTYDRIFMRTSLNYDILSLSKEINYLIIQVWEN